MSTYVDIVFDGPPEAVSGRFVEVENSAGQSVSLGKWLQRDDGYWVLRFRAEEVEVVANVLPTEDGWYLDRDGNPIQLRGEKANRWGQQPYHIGHFAMFAPFTRLVEEKKS